MTIRWLHLSDTHFREDELWDRRATLRALIAKVRELKEKGLAPDMVFVTGDIAWSGKPKEYEQATRFFTELNKVLELDPKDRWFLVPGNHDVDRSRITRSHRAIQAGLTDEEIVEETLRDTEAMRLLSTRLDAYYAFAADFLGAARALQPDRPWRTDVREFDGVSVGILQLNSAWIAEGGKTDEANLIVGEAQVREALDATPDAFLRIALMHHPLRNLREFDANRVESLLGAKSGSAFLLRGHLHLNRTKLQSSPDGNLFELAAGTLYTDEANWPRGFHLGEVDIGKGDARIHLFRYSGEGSGFFAPDNLTYENALRGICKIKVPGIYRLGGKKAKPTRTISEGQRLSFTSRYRDAAAAYHGHARFVGFPNQAARPNARVSDLFVPLRVKPKRVAEKAASLTTAEIAQRLLGTPQDVPARIVILGDPGAGKTTLSRFLVTLIAGAITMPAVKVAGEPVPVRVAFRDFVEKRLKNPNLSLLEYLDLQARTELSLTLPKDFLRTVIEQGQAVLILDGLDEVGAPEHRVVARDLVLGFSAAYRNVPILITSRISGYDDAPLGWQLSADRKGTVPVFFEEYALEKFDDDDLRTFVAHWYSVQEPTDPVARDRGIADLMAALDADDRVRELARTPILATLIAMIHRVEANLPGERAKLYDLCVRMLLETWPAQAKRPFTEIDPGLQRAYLETLAIHMQTERTKREAVTITRSDLVAKLLWILSRRDFASDPEEKVEGVIERWIDHLEKHSGIMVEQSTGLYAFFHLSIMEYLAARGIDREMGRHGGVAAIAEHFNDASWREVCLLAVGSHAEDEQFLDAVYEAVVKSSDIEQWGFLIRCLREEARFRPEQREIILREYAASALLGHSSSSNTIDQIRRFSVRHGDAVGHWIEHRLDYALADELAITVIAAWPNSELGILGRVANRPDRSAAAGALLHFWPSSALGEWAAREVDPISALNWSRCAPHDLAPLRAVAALSEPSKPLAVASLITLHAWTLRSCVIADANYANVQELDRPGAAGNGGPPFGRGVLFAAAVDRPGDDQGIGGQGLPPHITIKPGYSVLSTMVRSPLEDGFSLGDASSQIIKAFGNDFVREFAKQFASDFASSFTTAFAHDFAHYLVIFLFGYAFVFTGHAITDFYFRDFTDDLAREIAESFAQAVKRDVKPDFDIDLTDRGVTAPPRNLMATLRTSTDEENAMNIASEMVALIAGEAWIAVVTMVKSKNFEDQIGESKLRLQNRGLFEVWSAIDQRLPKNPSPAQLALYFALGWAQSTTTWAWPDSERWRTLFAAGPGEHWLVRSQWHLCKLTDDPASKDDDAGLRAALRDGHGDESLPGYAARLSEVLGIEA